MDFEVGAVLTGKVAGITKFGAFVTIAPGKCGLVHISEIANSYVSDISDFLKEGQDVTVKVLSVDGAGRVNLSIKQALPQPERIQYTQPERRQIRQPAAAVPTESSFEDKLKRFMQDSDSKISALYSDKKNTRRKR